MSCSKRRTASTPSAKTRARRTIVPTNGTGQACVRQFRHMAADVRIDRRRPRSWFFQPWAPLLVLAFAVALWVIVFFRVASLRHDRYGTFGFDLGIYDQATWLLAFFHRPFITVRGLDVFGHHAL